MLMKVSADMKKKNKAFYFLMGSSFLVILVWNLLTPQYADDLYNTDSSFMEILKKGYSDYFYWNGRIVGQTVMRFLNANNQILVSFVNSIMFILLVVLVLKLGFSSLKNISLKFGTTLVLLLLFIPAFGQTVLWRAGAGNYLWTMVLSLFYIFIYVKSDFLIPKKKITVLNCFLLILFIVLAVLVGWANENTSGGVLLVILLNTYIQYYNKAKFSIPYWLGIVANLIGYAMLLVSPGNKNRTIATMGKDYLNQSIVIRTLNGFYKVNQSIIDQYLPLLFLVIVLFALMLNYWFSKEKLINSGIWIFSGTATIYALSFAPMGQDGGRAYFGGIIFIIIGICQLLPNELIDLDRFSKMFIELIAICLLSYSGLTISNGLIDSMKADRAIRASYDSILKKRAVSGSNKIIKIPRLNYLPTTKYAINYGLEEIGKDPNEFPNLGYQKAFRVKGVILYDSGTGNK
ncbi:MAG: hypothetical protein DUD28_08515 [Lactobacillus sp.]|jgi:hypothetical protein|nr:MAG: hypothetical protein DUD28_08515 [Lactobacillus sp.]